MQRFFTPFSAITLAKTLNALMVAGQGGPIVLLHGYAETSHMWRRLIKRLAKTHTVIAPDLRGFGHIGLVGHDMGLMVAYAYAAQYPADVNRIHFRTQP